MFNPSPDELQSLISHVDQALYNHERWHEALVSTLVCAYLMTSTTWFQTPTKNAALGSGFMGKGRS